MIIWVLIILFLVTHVSNIYHFVSFRNYKLTYIRAISPLLIYIQFYQLINVGNVIFGNHTWFEIIYRSQELTLLSLGLLSLWLSFRVINKRFSIIFLVLFFLVLATAFVMFSTPYILHSVHLGVHSVTLIKGAWYYHVHLFLLILPLCLSTLVLIFNKTNCIDNTQSSLNSFLSLFSAITGLILFLSNFIFSNTINYQIVSMAVLFSLVSLISIGFIKKLKKDGVNRNITARFMFDHLKDAVLIYDHTQRILDCNEAVYTFFPGKKQQVVGEHISSIINLKQESYVEPCSAKHVSALINSLRMKLVVTIYKINNNSKQPYFLMILTQRK